MSVFENNRHIDHNTNYEQDPSTEFLSLSNFHGTNNFHVNSNVSSQNRQSWVWLGCGGIDTSECFDINLIVLCNF